jgi:phage shock protein PspC (stress-responsive transcriptional regulator)
MATFPSSLASLSGDTRLRPVSRSRTERWFGGVCGGVSRDLGIEPGWLRAAFAAGVPVGGIGIVVYVACWLIIPEEGELPGDASSGWIVPLAQACGVCVGMATLVVLGALAALFGFGWIAVAVAAAVLVAVLAAWPRLGPGWALLPVAAIALPAAAVAVTGVELSPQPGHVTIAPASLSAGGSATFRAGLGTTLVDLRRTSLPAAGTMTIHVQGGLRRTIVALPYGQCVHVELHYRQQPFMAGLASRLTGRPMPFPGVVAFGTRLPPWLDARSFSSPVPGPVLRIDFSSTGGGLYVRDYPTWVDPELEPNWPGFPVVPEARPVTHGLSKRLARYELGSWRQRHAGEVASQQYVDSLMGGPCAFGGVLG